ncbi:uncharacterized protein LOC135713102 [Ochlerotatus camptorhynchus]|uniref:uncharacterized protein LOC135713102 n=1 Tax=Ochlerotatus camptorhynchus TaxID=644619 RepID=UPI0031DF866E
MKKSSTQQINKPTVTKRLPSTALKPEDNQDTNKKVKKTEPVPKTSTRSNVKKVPPQSSQPTASRTEKKDKSDAVKPRTQTNPKASLNQSRKQIQIPNSNYATKKPSAGDFNVTVFSPPSARKAAPKSTKEQLTSSTTTRDRTRTRTLKPEEVTVMKNIPQITDEVGKEKAKPPPIAFDIQFENNKRSSSSSAKKQIANNVVETDNDEDEYDSEFESYESDFESGSSKKSSSLSAPSNKSSSSDSSSSTDTDGSFSSDEEHRKSRTSNEQKLDSGNYEMKLKRLLTTNDNSITFGNSSKQDDNQPDSGMNSGLFETQPASNSGKLLHKRYADILDKISFNTMAFELYEDEPAPYEYFVKNYGMVKGVQSQTQTETNSNSCETQTDNIYRKSCWIQYPPQFSISCLNNMNTEPDRYTTEKLGVGQENFHDTGTTSHQDDIFSDFLINLEFSKMQTINKTRLSNNLSCSFGDLCKFLEKSLQVVENVLIRNVESCDKPKSKTVQLKLQNLSDNSTVTAAHFDVNSHHVLLTLHECNVEKSHHRYVVSVWDTRNCVRPKAVLSCWSTVVCTDRIGPIVVAGTADGTLCLWNITESSQEISPFQLISPILTNDIENCHYGSVVAVRTANSGNGCSNLISLQVLTLFVSGVLVTWSISRADQVSDTGNDLNLNTIFHHANLRLIQQHVLKLFSIQKRLVPHQFSVSNSFQKGSLEDLLNSKNNSTDEHTKDELGLSNDMVICHNKAIILLNRQIIIVNCNEQEASLILKNQDIITNFKEHPKAKGCMFMLASDNTIKIMRISKHSNIASTQNDSNVHNAKQHSSHSNLKLSPVLNNKSCTIQNIVKNERKLYHEASSHADGLANPLSGNVDNNPLNSHQEHREAEPVPFYHNQLFFLKQPNQINSRLHFLNQGQILCVGADRNAKFIDLKTGHESYLSDYIATDSCNRRLLATTDKQVIMTTDGREIYLHDICGNMKGS